MKIFIRWAGVILLSIFLIGCASYTTFMNKYMNHYIGQDITIAYRSLGQPSRFIRDKDNYTGIYIYWLRKEYATRDCYITFMTRKNIITDWSASGDSYVCQSYMEKMQYFWEIQ